MVLECWLWWRSSSSLTRDSSSGRCRERPCPTSAGSSGMNLVRLIPLHVQSTKEIVRYPHGQYWKLGTSKRSQMIKKKGVAAKRLWLLHLSHDLLVCTLLCVYSVPSCPSSKTTCNKHVRLWRSLFQQKWDATLCVYVSVGCAEHKTLNLRCGRKVSVEEKEKCLSAWVKTHPMPLLHWHPHFRGFLSLEQPK